MNRTLFLAGLTDDNSRNPITTTTASDGHLRREATLTGVLPILDYIMHDRSLSASSEAVIVGQQQIRLQRDVPVNLFNLVGDADASKKLLHTIEEIERKVKPKYCFNRPENVFRTSRENLQNTLADIAGCRVPRVAAACPASHRELQEACSVFGSWPVIVRARGYHGGDRMLLLTNPEELESIDQHTWVYGEILLIEFVDFRDESGLYQKNRVVMIQGKPYPRHTIFSDQWSIHSGSRSDLMDANLSLCQREQEVLADFDDRSLKKFRKTFQQIHERIGLDVFGIDFALVNDEITIFEANACMNILNQDYGVDNRYHYLEHYVMRLKRAIKKMLMRV